MATEIERKFLVRNDDWRRAASQSTDYRQGYLSTDAERNVRVRTKGKKAVLTLKGRGEGLTRLEFEYEVPLEEAEQILDSLCLEPLIEKTRHLVHHGGFTWEVDEFRGDNADLVVAEVELESEDQAFELPDWVGEEVSDDPRYLNANLVSHPYSRWRDEPHGSG
jgi:CYTH domain-containing protein